MWPYARISSPGNTVKGAILKFDLNGKLLANIQLPDDPASIAMRSGLT